VPPVRTGDPGRAVGAGARAERTSPLVRRLAREHHLDVSRIAGTGRGGRVTRRDVIAHLARTGSDPAAGAGTAAGDVDIVPMTPMRKRIAEHMVLSRQTSAHAHTVFEVDCTRITALRESLRPRYQDQGLKPTYLSFISRAVVQAIGQVPVVNASLDGDNIVYRRQVHLGIAVALDQGLIVPVIHGAHALDLSALSRAIGDLARRARAKQLLPEDVQGGTFTITNHGVSGGLFGMPIINQPQVAILGVGVVQKRPVVVNDEIVARPMAYLTLGFDHRIIDGAAAERFMSLVKQGIEEFPDGSG
jgi:pyruvate/2-oxoglutarate dehydrogenase complex dihydrolipoamide acyltransferase (E2) component